MTERNEQRYLVVEARFQVPMLVLSVLLLPLLLVPVAMTTLSPGARRAFDIADWSIYAAFVIEYLSLLSLAPDRRRFVRTHILELLLVAVPVLRPLRIVRAFRAAQALRFGRAGLAASYTTRRGRQSAAIRGVTYVVTIAVILLFVGAVLELAAERHAHHPRITTFGDAMWWAVSTVTTVGYGDKFPVTGAGRVVAVVLMLTGIALVGVLTAAVAAWFVREDAQSGVEELEADELAAEETELAHLAKLREEVAVLRRLLLAVSARMGIDPDDPLPSTESAEGVVRPTISSGG